MKPFFDASANDKPVEGSEKKDPAPRRVIDREAVEMANKALKDAGFETQFRNQPDQGIAPIRYETEIFGNWQVDHGIQGADFVIQLIPRKPVPADPAAVVEAIIQVLSEIVPSDVQVYIKPPNPRFEIDFYTIRLAEVMKKPGAESIVQRRVPSELGQINAWVA